MEMNVYCGSCGWNGTQPVDGSYEADVQGVQAHDRDVLRQGVDPEGCDPLVGDWS